jgi:hypothetical protein
MSPDTVDGGFALLTEVTRVPLRRQEAVHFAGFLTREDDDAFYIADPQGTWIIPRDSVVFLEDWGHSAHSAPDYMKDAGRPVRVGVRDGATIQELRPWKLEVDLEHQFHHTAREAAEYIFTLGGEEPPISPHTVDGERRLAALEEVLSRKLGWNPDDPGTSRAGQPFLRQAPRSNSHTIVINDGYCDADCGF